MNVIWLAAAAFLGGVATGLLGWCDSQEQFVLRKFMGSLLRALFSGMVFAVTSRWTSNMDLAVILILAFLSGAGVDVLGNRISGAIKAGVKGKGGD